MAQENDVSRSKATQQSNPWDSDFVTGPMLEKTVLQISLWS
jgi:hypothetical protein